MDPATGPTLLGFDIFVIGSILSGVAALAVLFAIYTAVTIKDPMSKRVKALEGRREELKMGLVTASAKKRQSLVRNSDTTDKIKDTLGSMKVLQQSQILTVQQKLAHAGIRNKELAIVVIGLRAVLPILLGGFAFGMLYLVEVYPDWEMKRVWQHSPWPCSSATRVPKSTSAILPRNARTRSARACPTRSTCW